MNTISVVIPIYNEEENIIHLYEEIILSIKDYKYEIIFVNDYSNDNSGNILNKIARDNNFIKIIEHEKNLGQSSSLNSGILSAKYDIIVTLDGDGQNDPSDISKLFKFFVKNNSIKLVGGIRKVRFDPLIKIISSKIANFIRSLILNDHCQDTGCGLKIFSKKVYLELPFFDGMHRFYPALFSGFGYMTKFIEVKHRLRIKGKSNYGIFDRLFKGIVDIYKVKKIIQRHHRNKKNV